MTRYQVAHGFHLNVEATGTGPPLVLLHGFTGSASSWQPLIAALCRERRVVCVDIVGHGASDAPADLAHYRMSRAVADIVSAVAAAGVTRADWLGYSMGGRTAIALASAFPGAVRRLAVIGGSAGIVSADDRRARREDDERLALRILREGVPAFVDYWEAIPLFASQERLDAAVRARIRAERLRNDARGLANSLRGMGTGAYDSVDPLTVRAPTLLLAGALDSKYVAIGRELAQALPHGRFAAVPDVGHAAHLEAPGVVAGRIEDFFDNPLEEGSSV